MLSTDIPCLNSFFEPYDPKKAFFLSELGALDQGCPFKTQGDIGLLEDQEDTVEFLMRDPRFELERYD